MPRVRCSWSVRRPGPGRGDPERSGSVGCPHGTPAPDPAGPPHPRLRRADRRPARPGRTPRRRRSTARCATASAAPSSPGSPSSAYSADDQDVDTRRTCRPPTRVLLLSIDIGVASLVLRPRLGAVVARTPCPVAGVLHGRRPTRVAARRDQAAVPGRRPAGAGGAARGPAGPGPTASPGAAPRSWSSLLTAVVQPCGQERSHQAVRRPRSDRTGSSAGRTRARSPVRGRGSHDCVGCSDCGRTTCSPAGKRPDRREVARSRTVD